MFQLQTLNLFVSSSSEKLQEIKEAFNKSFDLYELLFDHVKDEYFFETCDSLRHPLIFYLAHTSCFYVNKLVTAGILKVKQRINPEFESQFAIGVDEMDWDDLITKRNWPSVESVREYRNEVRSLVSSLITTKFLLKDNSEITWNDPLWIIIMGIEHEKIHLETSSVLMRQLPLQAFKEKQSLFSKVCPSQANHSPSINWLRVQEGDIVIGRPIKSERVQDKEHLGNLIPIYGWDNEFGYHKASLPSFTVSDRLISNSDFQQFMKEEGYEDKQFWTEEGWKWASKQIQKHPKFWVKNSDSFVLRNMFSVTQQMPWNWPAEVNCFEANAYCKWLSLSQKSNFKLMSEDQYHMMLKQNNFVPDQNLNLSLKFASPSPVDLHKQGNIFDAMGNVWQWSRTPHYPFSGFECHPYYDDFTLPTFDNMHNLIKGGSWMSTGNLAQVNSRYAFRRHFFQHAGFRITQDENVQDQGEQNIDYELAISENLNNNPYELDSLVQIYNEFHWGSNLLINGSKVSRFPITCAMVCEEILKQSNFSKGNLEKLRVMDLGCAVGRTSFELTRVFDEVVGIDFSSKFIQVASMLKDKGSIMFKIPLEGEIFKHKFVSMQDLEECAEETKFMQQLFKQTEKRSPIRPQNVIFRQGDACNLSKSLNQFHLIFGANLIDRLYNPEKFLNDISEFILPNGFLLLLSPYTWLEEYTPKSQWIGGKQKDGENIFTRQNLETILSPLFEPFALDITGAGYHDAIYGKISNKSKQQFFSLPFSIQETMRKHQFTYSECTIWRKKDQSMKTETIQQEVIVTQETTQTHSQIEFISQSMRDYFNIPIKKKTHQEQIYFANHSLGLQPKATLEAIVKQAEDWGRYGNDVWRINEIMQMDKKVVQKLIPLIGADPEEVTLTSALTENIHKLISTFYQPLNKKHKILASLHEFPSDLYALKSQLNLKKSDHSESSLLLTDHTLKCSATATKQICEVIESQHESISLIWLSAVNYISSMLFDLKQIGTQCKKYNILFMVDLAHAIGAIPINLKELDIDAAVFCTSKYLNSGIGGIGGIYLNKKHLNTLPALQGWFGNKRETMLDFQLEFETDSTAQQYQISTFDPLQLVRLECSLDLFEKAGGINKVNQQSQWISTFIRNLLENNKDSDKVFEIITPSQNHGNHLALLFNKDQGFTVQEKLAQNAITVDCRKFQNDSVLRIGISGFINTQQESETLVQQLINFSNLQN